MSQIGTVRLQTQSSGTVDVPVFDTGDSGSGVYEFVRVQTASGTGFIPVVDPADASYPYLRVQSQNQGIVAVHNDSSLVKIVDDFEDGNVSEYGTYNVSGWGASTSYVWEGTYSGKLVNSTGGNSNAISTSGLQNYPSAGDTISLYWRDNGNSDVPNSGFLFGTQQNQQSPNGYRLYFGNNGIYLEKDSGATQIASNNTTLSRATWYKIEIAWGSGGNIDITVYDTNGNQVSSLFGSDSEYASGGIGMSYSQLGAADNSDSAFYDIIKLL